MLPNPSDYIDFRNERIWREVIGVYKVTLQFYSEANYACYTREKNAIIFIPEGIICKDSFMHELLHIYLKIKEIYIGSTLANLVAGNILAAEIYSNELIEHIGNCLDHSKMLSIYLAAGFDRQKFIIDYYIPKCSPEDLKLIQSLFNSNKYWPMAVNHYLGKFFGMEACPNLQIDYSPLLAGLKNLNSELYNILIEFWYSWEAFDINTIERDYFNYREMIGRFSGKLIEWTMRKRAKAMDI